MKFERVRKEEAAATAGREEIVNRRQEEWGEGCITILHVGHAGGVDRAI